jgi:hypothetical protein
VQDLDRPGAQHEEEERDPDERREPADPDEEAGTAEVRRVGARIRLETAATRKVARELDPAPGIGGRDGYGVCCWSYDVGLASVGVLAAGC